MHFIPSRIFRQFSRQIWTKVQCSSIFEMDGSYDNSQSGRGWHGNRGHRGHRGHRHYGSGQRRGQNYRRDDAWDDFDNRDYGHRNKGRRNEGRHFEDEGNYNRGYDRNAERGREKGGGGRGERPPPGLRGREIGMWYARRSKNNAKAKDREQRNEVEMEHHQRAHIERLLSVIKSDRDTDNQAETKKPSPIDTDWYESRNLVRDSFDEEPRPSTSQLSDKAERGASSGVDQSEESIEIDVTDTDEFDSIMKEWSEDSLLDTDTQTDDILVQQKELSSDARLNEELKEEFEDKQADDNYKKMMEFRKKLPSYKMRYDIVDLIEKNQVVVLSGETGCGKTTQVPQYILDDYLERGKGSECHIVCTQPRRISAISVAQRVAAERAEKLGQSVGYMIRLENELPRMQGSILYCTTGILLRKLETDPLLAPVSHIILDEIHERDLLSDFLIIILKDLLARRPNLKVILMSATLNAEAFSVYFKNCPMINVPGFTYPVKEYFLEDVLELLRYQLPSDMIKKQTGGWRRRQKEGEIMYEEKLGPWLRELYRDKKYSEGTLNALEDIDINRIDLKLIRDLIRYIVQNKGDGAILVFVPGWAEIGNLNKLLLEDRMFSSSSYRIIPLHSMMPTLNQRQVFDRPPPGVRKIVIATNIAETSITIDDIVYVIDSGKIKVKGFSPEDNLLSLQSEMVSLANAKQRKGRAGRVQAGECFHLFTALQRALMMDYLPPEILRTPLEELCLQIKLLKLGKIIPFVEKAMQPPSLTALQSAIQNLQDLNALDKKENLLPLGKHLARMPMDPHTGKMLLFAAMFGCLDPILTIAASLSFKDPFYVPLGKEKEADLAKLRLSEGCMSDHILLVKTFNKWLDAEESRDWGFCNKYFLSKSTLQMLKKMRGQLADILKEIGFVESRNSAAANHNSDNMSLVKSIVCAGLYPNVGKIKKLKTKRSNMKFTLKDESRCELHPKSVTSVVEKPNTQWMVYHKKMKTTAVFIYDCSLVSSYALLFFGGEIQESVDETGNIVTVDDWIKFKASRKIVSLVKENCVETVTKCYSPKELRQELDIILDEKISKTNAVSWEHGTKQGALISAIVDLVTTETGGVQEDENFSD